MSKTNKLDRKLSEAVTGRFMQAMAEIIAEHRRKDGKYPTVADFAKSVHGNAAYMSQYKAPYYRNVTLEMCCMLCKVHKVNANWLLLGVGDRYGKDEAERLDKLEARIKVIEQFYKAKINKKLTKL